MAKGGGWIIAVVLVGAVAMAGNEGDGSSSSSSSSSSASNSSGLGLFGDDEGGVCDHTTQFTSSQGTYTIPSNNSDDPVTARNCFLAAGQGSGAPVETLQRALVQCHHQNITVDGDFGADTTAAVKLTQAQVGVPVDGRYGPQTAGAMAWPTLSDDGKSTCVVHPA
jgi:hypothetical protein